MRYPPRPIVKRGHVRDVTANIETAYLVTGGWTQVIKGGNVSPTTWSPERGSVLLFQVDDYWFHLLALPNHPDADFDEAELVKIAESLQPVK